VGLAISGPVMIDGDATPGLQAARRVVDVNVGDVISVEVYGRGISGASGFSAILSYDKAQLSFEGFDATQIIPGFTGLRLDAGGTVEIGGASVTGTSGSAEGRLGVLRFKVLRGFTGTTSIELVGGRLTLGADITNYTSDLILSVSGIAGGGPLVKTPDFNGNGVVDFPDFLMFASAFGKKVGDVGFLEALDLNDSGAVDFPDFLSFAQQFGKSVG
ncbi:MAG: cohesin domain-containing protein, partial [Candidatus Latescibacterota bacterium]